MSIAPLVALFGMLLTQVQLLVPAAVGFGLLLNGGRLAIGDHKGKEGMMMALIGGAVMVTSAAIGATIHA